MGGDAGTQFEPHSDDEDTLYNVEKILDEAGRRYLVQWEGRDPATGKKWPPDWVPKTDCTDDLIADWKLEKERRKRGRSSNTKSACTCALSLLEHSPTLCLL
ncbi:hypothetical protein BDV93DRAFT_455137 [Ceratobasidium sp. AG-I]|nr:hypothetical protein BDV93DRAFT_455137 [Ceratobasidium sp. AG-I]